MDTTHAALTETTTPTLLDMPRIRKKDSSMDGSEALRRGIRRKREIFEAIKGEEDDEDDENEDGDKQEEEVGRKIVALQKIIPGGESLGVDELFEETAGYILTLQRQLKAMKVLSSFLDGLERERMKLGG